MTAHQMSAPAANAVTSQDGATIHYLTLGHGPAVIVIPGTLSVAADYLAFGAALAERCTVHIIERRGRGLSSPQGADYSIDHERADVLALQRQTGATRLVGHSFGGFVALEAARDNPALTKVAVYEPGVSIAGSIPTGWMPRYQRKLARHDNLGAFVEFIRAMGPAYLRFVPRWYLKLLLPKMMPPLELRQRLSLAPESLREHQEEARLDSTYENYRAISADVLLMYGGKSDGKWVQLAMERLAAVLPHAQTLAFPKLDHFGIDQKAPREVAQAVARFLLND